MNNKITKQTIIANKKLHMTKPITAKLFLCFQLTCHCCGVLTCLIFSVGSCAEASGDIAAGDEVMV